MASGAFFAIGVFFTYKPEPPLATRGQSWRQIVRDFDYVGMFGLTAGLVLLLAGIIFVPSYGSTSAVFIAPFIIGFFTLVATGVYGAYLSNNAAPSTEIRPQLILLRRGICA